MTVRDMELVSAEPARSHVLKLKEMGLSQSDIARAAGVERWAVSELLTKGRPDIPEPLANALLAVDHDTRQGDWTKRGACRSREADALAYEYGLERTNELYFPPPDTPSFIVDELSAAADSLCERCPVRSECLNYATETGQVGRWAGTDEADRKKLKKGTK